MLLSTRSPFLRSLSLSLAIAAAAVVGCEKRNTVITPPPTPDPATETLRSAVLCDLVQNVVLPTLDDFDARAADLEESIAILAQSPTEGNLAAARQAWRETRAPWEMCEAFLFGPAKSQQIDPAVDSWPLDEITLDSILRSRDDLTADYFARSEGTVKGAHAIEFLLWGSNGDKTIAQITPRELEFMAAAAEDFRANAWTLRRAWRPLSWGGGGYGEQVCQAGQPGSIYRTSTAGVREFFFAISSLMLEVSDGKMGIPYANQTVEFEEARFSGNSKDDFRANVLGARSLYYGAYGARSGKGLRDLVMAADPSLAAEIDDKMALALANIDRITPSFARAITSNRASIQTTRVSLTELSELFAKKAAWKLGLMG